MNLQIPKLSAKEVFERWNQGSRRSYYAMYSSWVNGIITDPNFMVIPMDDHMVHRGDGVFEAMKLVNGGIYLLEEHLKRLFVSGGMLDLGGKFNVDELREIILQTCRAAFETYAQKNPQAKPNDFKAIVRLFLSRGPGNFTANPYETLGHQFYCVVTEYKAVPEEKFLNGVSIGKSRIPVKQSWFPTVKSCNYLPNVLMKKESVDRGLDFTVSFNDEGYLAESSTENIFTINESMQLVHPHWEAILRGTTLIRFFEIAGQHQWLPVKGAANISEKDLIQSLGVFMAGTTLDVIPVSKYEGMSLKIPKVYEKMLGNS